MQSLSRWYSRNETAVLGVSGVLLFMVVWEIGGRTLDTKGFVSYPTEIYGAFQKYVANGQMLSDTLISLKELGYGFSLAAVVGIPLGMMMGRYRWVEYVIDPYFWFFYSSPTVALFPLLIFWLGLGQPTIIALTFILAIFTITANVIVGVQEVDPVLIRAARSFGASQLQVFGRVVIPSALPAIASGLRLGMGRALIGTIVGEFFGSNEGLGFRISYYGGRLRTTDLLAYVVVVLVVGVVLTQTLQYLENRLSTWRAG